MSIPYLTPADLYVVTTTTKPDESIGDLISSSEEALELAETLARYPEANGTQVIVEEAATGLEAGRTKVSIISMPELRLIRLEVIDGAKRALFDFRPGVDLQMTGLGPSRDQIHAQVARFVDIMKVHGAEAYRRLTADPKRERVRGQSSYDVLRPQEGEAFNEDGVYPILENRARYAAALIDPTPAPTEIVFATPWRPLGANYARLRPDRYTELISPEDAALVPEHDTTVLAVHFKSSAFHAIELETYTRSSPEMNSIERLRLLSEILVQP